MNASGVRGELEQLLHRAEAANFLLFILNLQGWSGGGGLLDFQEETYSLVGHLLAQAQTSRSGVSMPEAAMIVVLLLESKAPWSTMQNFFNQLSPGSACGPVAPSLIDPNRKPGNSAFIGTKAILVGLKASATAQGFHEVSEFFDQAINQLIPWRHSIAHGTFRSATPSRNWLEFHDLRKTSEGTEWVARRVSPAEWANGVKTLVGFHQEWMRVLESRLRPLLSQEFDFTAQNPADPAEWLDCSWIRGQLRVRMGRTPFWHSIATGWSETSGG